jgi:hypothetical protein
MATEKLAFPHDPTQESLTEAFLLSLDHVLSIAVGRALSIVDHHLEKSRTPAGLCNSGEGLRSH